MEIVPGMEWVSELGLRPGQGLGPGFDIGGRAGADTHPLLNGGAVSVTDFRSVAKCWAKSAILPTFWEKEETANNAQNFWRKRKGERRGEGQN